MDPVQCKYEESQGHPRIHAIHPQALFLYSCLSEAVLVSSKLTLRRCNRKIQLHSLFHKHSSSNSTPKLCLILSPCLWLPFSLFTAYMIRNILSFFSKVVALLRPLRLLHYYASIFWCSFAARKQMKVSYKQILSLLLCPLCKGAILSGTYSCLCCPLDDLVCAGADGVPATSRLDKQAL